MERLSIWDMRRGKFSEKNGFSIISKYNYVRDDAKVDKKNYENTADSNEWFQKWYDDKVYISEEELEMLDFTYGLDGVCVGFNQKQIVDAVRGVTDSLITLGASSLGFIAELKAAYGDYVTVIHLFEDVLTVEQSVVKYGVFSESEKVTRVAANKEDAENTELSAERLDSLHGEFNRLKSEHTSLVEAKKDVDEKFASSVNRNQNPEIKHRKQRSGDFCNSKNESTQKDDEITQLKEQITT